MYKIIIYPKSNCYISNKDSDYVYPDEGLLFAGVDCNSSLYRSLLYYDIGTISENAEVVKAVLKLYTNNKKNYVDANTTPYMITSSWDEKLVTWKNQPPIDIKTRGSTVEIDDNGWYKWDITGIVRSWHKGDAANYGLLVKTKENVRNDIKRFYSTENEYENELKPHLKIYYVDGKGTILDGRKTSNIFDIYCAGEKYKYTNWFNCSNCSTYTFFVENIGLNRVEVSVQISPDRNTIFDENAVFYIEAGSKKSIVPIEYSYFCRLAFKTLSPKHKTQLKIWFQSQI